MTRAPPSGGLWSTTTGVPGRYIVLVRLARPLGGMTKLSRRLDGFACGAVRPPRLRPFDARRAFGIDDQVDDLVDVIASAPMRRRRASLTGQLRRRLRAGHRRASSNSSRASSSTDTAVVAALVAGHDGGS